MEQPFKARIASRKFVLMVLIFCCATVCLTLPALFYLISGVQLAALLTGGEFVSLTLGAFAIYSGANVVQRKIETPPSGGPADDMMGD